ncbi:ATP-binding protein [sulfur-oxidizing endosymbiont of Gigantopelta aegis]|uniref:ATP-binding protein n=1 Tax=sulfur-oxidizing endosymbiont of Gigantopelta aegis TaxID=2794934 RepID=UPI0018DC961A|nr:ATP-binding protein [sulfur-oxidizing endosymbiont of Gigantopelta aegis]
MAAGFTKAIELDWEPELFLAHLCELETSYRHDNKLKRLLRESKLPIGKQLSQYDFNEITGVTAQQLKQKNHSVRLAQART